MKSRAVALLASLAVLTTTPPAAAAAQMDAGDTAVQLMRAAVDLEGSIEKHPVTPGPIVPARELLGDLLLELGRPGEAPEAFEGSLGTWPDRFNALYGAARSAELAGDLPKAKDFYARLAALGQQADAARPELVKARTFLANGR